MPLLWHIDDGLHLLAVTEATVLLAASWRFEGFTTGHAALAEYARRSRSDRPDVILMDYFIGEERGDAVTLALRQLDPSPHRTRIIGHSSVRRASEAIVRAGGQGILSKHRNPEGINPALRDWLQTPGG
jgi:DNA-binding NarL/FixJ family response regulator